jgi:long-chain acyl-CoA synthetase
MAARTRDEIISDLTRPGERFEIALGTGPLQDTRCYRNAPQSLREVLLSARRFAEREFLVYETTRLTYAEHHQLVAAFARHLHDDLQVRHGERVAIAMRNLPEWSVAFWAIQAIGAVAVPLNAWWAGAEMAFAIRDSGSVVLVADDERVDRLMPILPELGLRSVITSGGAYLTAINERVVPWLTLPEIEVGPDDLSTIVYTSGTTGTPKGAAHLHRNHCSAVMNNLMFVEIGRSLSGRSDESQAAALLTFPLFHVAGLVNLYLSVASGSKLVLLRKWETDKAVELILAEGVSSTVVVPTVLRQILESDRLRDDPRFGLAAIAAGGAPVPAELVTRVASRFGGRVAPGNGYGLTETTAGVMSSSGDEYVANPASIGRPFPVVDVRIVDPEGGDVVPGEVGELWLRGPNVIPGYWNNPDATALAFTDGWFHTGDLGRCDDVGRYYIVDRLKDVVIRGGENIYCAEVEAVLSTFEDVMEVAVFGMPHESLGEEVVAVVRFGDGPRPDLAAFRSFAAARLAYFKVPSRIIAWHEELPKTASGKLLKRDLRDRLNERQP